MVLCVAGRSIDVDDHGGETSKPKAHNNKDEKGELRCSPYCQNWLFLLCLLSDTNMDYQHYMKKIAEDWPETKITQLFCCCVHVQ